MHWCNQYIGTAWKLAGKSKEEGFDCWTLFKYLQKKYYQIETACIPMQKYSTKKAAKEFQTNKELDNWQIVAANKIKDGDGVIMKISHRPIHVGIYIEPSKYEKGIIHTEESTGVIYSNFYNLKKNHWFIDKFLRHISKI